MDLIDGGIIIGLTIILVLSGAIIYMNFFSYNEFSIPDYECIKDTDAEQAVNCLHANLMTFFNYNYSNYKTHLTFEELKERGGVCWHYTKWYIESAKKLGYKAKEINIKLTDDVGHVFAVINDKYTYCIVDQTFKPECYNMDTDRAYEFLYRPKTDA